MWSVLNPLDECWRFCVYCGADCWPDREYQRHAADCPTVTGVYPVREQECVHGEPRCTGCSKALAAGSMYLLRDPRTGRLVVNPTEDVSVDIVCVGCTLPPGFGAEAADVLSQLFRARTPSAASRGSYWREVPLP